MNSIATEPREMLKNIIARNGDQILQDQDRCEGLLKDHCGLHRREIAALVGALEERVPLELKSSWQSAMTPEAMRSRLVQRMQDNRGLTQDLANWAVDAWSYALGVGLGRRSDRVASVVVSTPMQDFGAAGANPELAREFGNAAFAGQPPASQPQGAGVAVKAGAADHQKNDQQKKLLAVVVAAVALYYAYNHFHQADPNPAKNCPEGQIQAGDGTCVAQQKGQQKGQPGQAKKQPGQTKGQPWGQPDGQPGQTNGRPEARNRNPKTANTSAGLAAGTLIPVTVSEVLNSDTVIIGQYVKGTISEPILLNGKTVVPEGTQVILQVKGVDQSGRVLGAAKIDLALVEMTIGAKKYTIASANGVVTGPSKTVRTVKHAGILGGIGTGIGCGVGAVLKHPGAGCAAGAVGGATTGVLVSANEKPQPAVLEPGKVVRFKLAHPVDFA